MRGHTGIRGYIIPPGSMGTQQLALMVLIGRLGHLCTHQC
jgi:hypothetical protein